MGTSKNKKISTLLSTPEGRVACSAMRGIAILAIMLHNFTHWLGPMVKENEYTFSEHHVRRLMVELAHPSIDIFAHLLSFFGHYGVHIFVFLSAYGLVKKYESNLTPQVACCENGGKASEIGAWEFIKTHYLKLFTMLLVGFSAFMIVDFMTPGHYKYQFMNIVGTVCMFANLYPDPDHSIWPGPYWYFGLMVQLYLAYRLVFYPGSKSICGSLSKKHANVLMVALLLITLFAQLCFEPESDELNYYRYNVTGALPVFIAGIFYARNEKELRLCRVSLTLVVICSTLLIITGSLYFTTWIFVPFIIIAATIALVKLLPQFAVAPLAWVGSVSAAMFISHPIARKIFIPISRHGDIYTGLLVYVIVAIMLSIMFKNLIANVQNKK